MRARIKALMFAQRDAYRPRRESVPPSPTVGRLGGGVYEAEFDEFALN